MMTAEADLASSFQASPTFGKMVVQSLSVDQPE